MPKSLHIVIIRLDHLGDILLCTPLARALAKAGHDVEFVVPSAFAPALERNPSIREVTAIEKVCPGFPARWWQISAWLRERRPDVVLLPYGKPAALLAASLLSGTRRRLAMWAGLPGRVLLHQCLRSGLPKHPRHFAAVMLDLAMALGVEPDGLRPDFFLSREEETLAADTVARRLTNGTRIIGIHPGCAGNTCNLPPAEYRRLTEAILNQTDFNIVITGTAAEGALLNDWSPAILGSPRIWNSVGTLKLRELAAVISQMDLFCVPSTGPLHIASALGKPTLSPFCPLDTVSDTVWGNLGGSAQVIRPDRAACEHTARCFGTHCSFRGEVTGDAMFEEALKFIRAVPIPDPSP